MLCQGAGQCIGDHQHVAAHRMPGVRLGRELLCGHLLNLLDVMLTVDGQQIEHRLLWQVRIGAAGRS